MACFDGTLYALEAGHQHDRLHHLGRERQVEQRLAVPDTCLAPVVMVHPNGATTAYIAISGFRP